MARSKLNLLNLTKTPDFFACFVADPGHKLVYADASALEPHVAAHLTQDPNLLKIYGKGRPPNDVYSFTGAHMSFSREQIREYYDPDNPTKESIKAVKQHLGELRGLLKTEFLALMYGAYPKRLHAYLRLLGYKVTLAECQRAFDDFHDTYRGLKAFERKLHRMWGENGGYIINGRGLPVAVAEEKLKDINNTVFQGTGHMILMSVLFDMNRLRHERQVDMRPYLVDWHDASCWTTPDNHVEQTVEIFKDSVAALNQRLNWTVEIKMEPTVGSSLADFLDD